MSSPSTGQHVSVREEPPVVASRQRTWLALTASGRRALAGHVAELQRLLAPATEAVEEH